MSDNPIPDGMFVFKSPHEMYRCLLSGVDLYSPEMETYMFLYSETGSIAYYSIDKKLAQMLSKRARDADEYWGAFLGIGGYIIDEENSIIEFLRDYYTSEWMDTKKFEAEEDC